jgi:hypothetical protein
LWWGEGKALEVPALIPDRAAIYGYARAITPLFDKPLEGPVYPRSSNNQLPDLVAALNGQVNVFLYAKNDSIHGGLRNSTDICQGTHKANVRFVAHNGKVVVLRPQLQAKCGGKGKKRGEKRRG